MRDLQYFWEAFPAGSGPGDRTTYMFTYVDADPSRSATKHAPPTARSIQHALSDC